MKTGPISGGKLQPNPPQSRRSSNLLSSSTLLLDLHTPGQHDRLTCGEQIDANLSIFLEAFQTRTVTNFPGTINSVSNGGHWLGKKHTQLYFKLQQGEVCLGRECCVDNCSVWKSAVRTIESSLHEIIGRRPGVPPRHASPHRPRSQRRQNIRGVSTFFQLSKLWAKLKENEELMGNC